MTQQSKAYKAVIRARTCLIVSNPFFGCLALHLDLIEDINGEVCTTAAVDGVRMWFHPPFVLSLTEQELVGVVAHETMHCAFRHMTRRGQRDPGLWNIAGDFVINSDLKKSGFTLPGQPISMKSPPGTKGHLLDPQFEGMGTEEVYEKIWKDVPKIYISMSGVGTGKGGKDGQGQGLPQDPGGCGGVIDAAAGHDKVKSDQVDRDWEATVRMAVAVARANNAGTVPGHLERLVKQLKAPKISWRDQTRHFIDNSMTKDYSYARPNRRYLHSGLIMPGFVPDALHHMVFIVDTSGSISDKMLQACGSEVAGALDEGAADRLTVLYADTEVQHVDEYVQGDLVEVKIHGGGGTDFVDAFNWVNKNAPDASCVVYLTDMQPSHWNLPEIDAPVLWAASCTEQFLAQVKVPFGEIVMVDSAPE